MAVYTDSQLNDRIDATLPTNHAGAIDADELRDLLKDINDSKINVASGSGIATPIMTILASELTNGAVTKTHNLNTAFPVVFIKGNTSDMWGEVHYTATPVGTTQVSIAFEDELPVGSSVEFIVLKFA